MTNDALTPLRLYDVLQTAWSIETSSQWRSDNPARGQCAVTALVVQDLIGGDILKTEVNGTWHFYNFIHGRRWDLTISQFEKPIGYEDIRVDRSEALADTSTEQYRLLLACALSSLKLLDRRMQTNDQLDCI